MLRHSKETFMGNKKCRKWPLKATLAL